MTCIENDRIMVRLTDGICMIVQDSHSISRTDSIVTILQQKHLPSALLVVHKGSAKLCYLSTCRVS